MVQIVFVVEFIKEIMDTGSDQLHRLRIAMQSNGWFKQCSDDLQASLISLGKKRNLVDAEVLSESSQIAPGLWCVLAGRVRLIQPTVQKQQLIRDYLPYDWFGEISLIDDLPSGLKMLAYGETTLLEIERGCLLAWLENNPVYWRDFARLISFRFRYGSMMFNHATNLGLKERLLQRLYMISAAYGMGSRLAKRIRYSQKELANMLGVSRPSITIELGKLVEQGVLELKYGEIFLLKPRKPFRHWDASSNEESP